MAEEKKLDRRVVKTKKAIRNAFAKLISEKDINKITIKDIADTADINRKTFYNYYGGVYEIIEEIEKELVGEFEDLLSGIDLKMTLRDPSVLFSRLTEKLTNNLEFYGYLMKASSSANLFVNKDGKLDKCVRSAFASQMDIDEQTIAVMTDFILSGMLVVYHRWFNSDRSADIDSVSQTLGKLCCEGIAGIVGEV